VSLDRRRFLKGTGVGVAGALAGALSAPDMAGASASDPPNDGTPSFAHFVDGAARLPAVPFHGPHQAGILTPQQPAAAFISFDSVAATREELGDLLAALTSRARFLTSGGEPPYLGTGSPPSDSGTLGPQVPTDGLTVTVGVGSELFDDRYGLAARKPVHLVPMQAFPNDDLDPAFCGGDILLQLCAGSTDVVLHALRDIAKHTRGGMQVRWRIDGYLSPPRPDGAPRNNLGFMDGIANPRVDIPPVADRLLWVAAGSGEPRWAETGSYHVVRLIRMFIEFWDRVSLSEQQEMIGRYRASGAPIGMTSYRDVPDYGKDPYGLDVPLTAHIRLANPRTSVTERNRIFRRSYNYDLGTDLNGDLNVGHVFTCFQQNIKRQFETVQQRLINEALDDYVSPFGGGYFFALPGVKNESDWYGRDLLQS
jgi:deferrochelatase/peroxidase EfeB